MMVISIVAFVTQILVVLAFVCFHSLSFVTAFYCKLLIYTQECKFVVSINDLVGNYSPTRADGAGLGDPNIQLQTYECRPLDFYHVFFP